MLLFQAKSVIPTKRMTLPTIGQQKLDLHPLKAIFAIIEHQWKTTIAASIENLTTEPELKIWQKVDRNKCIHWYARDPVDGKSICFASETEMLRWIENLNHRSRW
jgi:hypothetical protein